MFYLLWGSTDPTNTGPRNRKITKSLDYEKCPETGKLQHLLITESVQKQENYKIPWLRKVSRNRKITKFFEGVTENEKCLETGKWQNPLVVLKTWLTRGPNWPFRCLDCVCGPLHGHVHGAVRIPQGDSHPVSNPHFNVPLCPRVSRCPTLTLTRDRGRVSPPHIIGAAARYRGYYRCTSPRATTT